MLIRYFVTRDKTESDSYRMQKGQRPAVGGIERHVELVGGG
jgi:hypothetical protein